MSLVIDTSVLIDSEKGRKETLSQLIKLKEAFPSKPKISFITCFEFMLGLKNRSSKNKERAMAFLNKFEVIHTTDVSVKNLVNLKEKYELPLADLIIASQTMENADTLVTSDKDFKMINEINKIFLEK